MRSALTFGVFILVGIGGCASVAGLRGKEPVAIRTSPKSAASVAECIRGAWTAQRIGIEANGARTTNDGSTLLVVSPPGGYPSEVAEVTPVGASASQTKFFAQASVDIGDRTGKRLSAIDTCM